MIKVVHATATKSVPVSMASGTVRAVLRSNVSAAFRSGFGSFSCCA